MIFNAYNRSGSNVQFAGDNKQTITIGDQTFEVDGRLVVVIEVVGDVKGDVKTMSGDVNISGSAGNITTMSGDVDVGGTAGRISTMSGDVRTR